nr:DEAD/DEAH box helicase [Shouchella xiaoxiensis]
MLENLRLSSPSIEVSSDDAYQLFINEHQRLVEIGIKLIVPTSLKKPQALRVMLENKGEQLEENTEPILNWQSLANFQYSIAIGNQTIDENEFKQFVQEKQPFIYVNGEWIAWDPTLATELKQYLERVNQHYSYLEAWKMEETESFPEQLEDVDFKIQWSDSLKDKLTDLYKNDPEETPLPAQFNGNLRPYQKKGFDWLIHLRKVGFGGCLADDMGLGKSIQTIAYMLYVLENQPNKKAPFLLICPTSLLYNWQLECEKFAPHLKLFIHHGSDRLKEDEPRLHDADLVITSYTLALKDATLFNHVHWNGLILDEAQHIKNKETKQRRAIRQIHAVHRLALTGTPIENRLTELWSLMDLLNPSLLGGYQSFLNTYIRPIEREKNQQKQDHLRSLIKPFLLRRTKKDSETDLQLPTKNEHSLYVELSLEQAALYQAVVDDISDRIHTVSSLERRAMILRAITRLKQICNHPAQFHKDQAFSAHQSGKWDQFVKLTDSIHARKESTLIFTQYKEMGKMIAAYLEEEHNQTVPFLHGGLSRKQRQHAVEQFQTDSSVSFFVLSLKAGGVGLNLTKATNVIHYDRWWNPAVENQATDRAYRIGQTKEVDVYKLLTTGTVEERIDRLIIGKQALADGVLASSTSITELSDDELLSLIRLNIQ